MQPQKVVSLKSYILLTAIAMVNSAAAFYVIGKQDKELQKLKIAFRTMSDVAGMYEEYAPGEVIAQANEKMAFAQIQIKYDE